MSPDNRPSQEPDDRIVHLVRTALTLQREGMLSAEKVREINQKIRSLSEKLRQSGTALLITGLSAEGEGMHGSDERTDLPGDLDLILGPDERRIYNCVRAAGERGLRCDELYHKIHGKDPTEEQEDELHEKVSSINWILIRKKHSHTLKAKLIITLDGSKFAYRWLPKSPAV